MLHFFFQNNQLSYFSEVFARFPADTLIQSRAGETYVYDDGSFKSKATWTNWACQTSSEPLKPPADDPPVNPKEPPCAATEGVLTSSSGKVACVPYGTPSPRKPDVKVREKKETFPDNSTKTTTETKTTDPKTNASHTHTTTTSSGGMAGPAGTTEGKESETGDGNGGDGDGDCEGDDCGEGDGPDFTPPEGGDLYESSERTIRNVIDDFVNAVSAAPAIQAAQSFFVPGSMPASCGGMSTNVPMIDVTVSLDEYLCGESAQTIIVIAGVIVLAIAAFAAFRIGFL